MHPASSWTTTYGAGCRTFSRATRNSCARSSRRSPGASRMRGCGGRPVLWNMINAACAGVVILALVLFGTAVAATRPVVEGWSPILDDLFPAVAGACAVLAVAAVAALRRGAPGRRRHCAMILLALLAIPFGSVGAVVLANQYLDAGSSREYEARPATGALTLVP